MFLGSAFNFVCSFVVECMSMCSTAFSGILGLSGSGGSGGSGGGEMLCCLILILLSVALASNEAP